MAGLFENVSPDELCVDNVHISPDFNVYENFNVHVTNCDFKNVIIFHDVFEKGHVNDNVTNDGAISNLIENDISRNNPDPYISFTLYQAAITQITTLYQIHVVLQNQALYQVVFQFHVLYQVMNRTVPLI